VKRERLRQWIAATSGRISLAELRDDTPLLESRLITSLQVMDLILFIESLAGKPLELERLQPGRFRDIDSICRSFLEER
jgi:acyl carrier protein